MTPTVEEDLALGRYLFRAFQRMPEDEWDEVTEKLSEVKWLLCSQASKPDTVDLRNAGEAYLGKRYTDDPGLEDYFSASPDTWIVSEDYHETGEEWLTFLETLGCSSVPRKIEDGHEIDGLKAILIKLSGAEGEKCLHLARTIFDTLSASIPDDEYERKSWGTVTTRVWVRGLGRAEGTTEKGLNLLILSCASKAPHGFLKRQACFVAPAICLRTLTRIGECSVIGFVISMRKSTLPQINRSGWQKSWAFKRVPLKILSCACSDS